MIELVRQNRDAIADLARAYGVQSLDVFGSAATGAFNEESSDIDFVVDFGDMSPGIANRYLDFAEALERLLGRPVDLMFEGPITKRDFRDSHDGGERPKRHNLTGYHFRVTGQFTGSVQVRSRADA